MRLADIDREMDAVVAPLKAERVLVQAEIDKVAAQIVALSSAARVSQEQAHSAPEVDDDSEPEPDVVQIPPRRRKLLALLAAHPSADYAELCLKMYGKDNQSVRSALSAEFSGLKSTGFVEPVDRGQYKLTDLGRLVTSEAP